MVRKLSPVFGIIGGALTMLPGLGLAAQSIWTLLQPDGAVHFEAKGYASFFVIVGAMYTLISGIGLTGGLIVRKKPALAGVLMLISGMLMLMLAMQWYYQIAPLLLVAAGILALFREKSGKASNMEAGG